MFELTLEDVAAVDALLTPEQYREQLG
jgi:hypothetical protein